MRLFGQMKISLLLKMEWKQHHILNIKIVYKYTQKYAHSEERGEDDAARFGKA
jgi:hypothetical protein